MKKEPKTKLSRCPVAFALDLVGDKWNLLIIRDLVFKEKKFYGEFLVSPERISTNILADRLANLERTGIVCKDRDQENLSRYIYRLTTKGKDLLPIILEMVAWSTKYDAEPSTTRSSIIHGAPNQLLKKLRRDREALIAEILSKLK